MSPSNPRSTLSASWDTALLCGVIVISPQLLGGAFPWSIVLIAGMALASLAAALWVRRHRTARVVDGLFVAITAAWVWTCVQALPLPTGLARALRLGSIESAERLDGLAWAGTVPLTISYDPGSTVLHVLTGVAIVSAFLAARARGEAGLKPVASAVVVSALLICLVGLGHQVYGASALYGVYSPRFTQPQLLTPLMNGNHLGGFAMLGALIAGGLVATRPGKSRAAWAAAASVCVVTVAWTLSRGALGALLFGLVLLAAWLVRVWRSDGRGAAIPVAVAVAVGAGAFFGLEPLLRRFESQGFDKLATAARGLGLLEGSALWLGVGRGAFSAAFVNEEGSRARFTHPENIVVQWTTEWGLVVAAPLLVLLSLALWKRFRTAQDPLVASTCIAIVALALQNLVDFSLEMTGIAVVVAAMLGSLLPAPNTSHESPVLRVPTTLAAVFAVVLVALGPSVLGSDTQSIVDELTRAMESDDEERFRAALARGLALHPAEPAFPLLAGTYAGSRTDADAPRWLSVAMEEAPGWAAPHLVAAQLLLDEGLFDQALIEIREAEERHPGSGQSMVCEVLTRSPSLNPLERAAPGGDLRVPYLDRAAACQGLPATLRAEIDAVILQSDPTRPSAVLRQVRRLVSQGQGAEAEALLERSLADNPDDVRLWVAITTARLSGGDIAAAASALDAARARGLDSRPLTESQARLEAAQGQTEQMRATIGRLRGQSRGEARLVAASFLVEGDLEASLGNVDEALAAYEAADVANPRTPALQRAAKLAEKAGRHSRARRFYQQLCRRQPNGPSCAEEDRMSGTATKDRRKPPRP